MRYLLIDKEQRVEVEGMGQYPTADMRIMEELDKEGIPYHFSYDNQLEFIYNNDEFIIKANGEDIRNFSHIMFRGHHLHKPRTYHFKRYIIDYIDMYNQKNPDKKILIQNSKTIKHLPYYNKIETALFCKKNSIPYFNTYFRTDGDYTAKREYLNEYPLIIKEYAGVNRLEVIDGVEKVKKNVYKLDSEEDLNQEYLKDQNKEDFFIQQFSPEGKDMRIFVKLGEVVGGWYRESTSGFMTVSKGEYTLYNNPEPKIKDLALKVANLLEADFIAVDFMFLNGEPLLQEISLHPGFKAYETKIEGNTTNLAKEIITAFSN